MARSSHVLMAVEVLIVESNPLHRRFLIEFLRRQPGTALVGVAATLDEALAICRSRRPNLVVASLSPVLRRGLEIIRAFKDCLPEAHIAVLLDVDDERYRQAALDQGARFCVAKTALRWQLGPTLEGLQHEAASSASERS
jgi:DNA-binding NarL/FixJ family response regulator